jgi:hypothetical protein
MTQPSPPTPSAPAAVPPANPRPDRRVFVLTMITAAVLLFIATGSLLYYRWATMVEPTCLLIIDTGEPLRGAQIEVDGVILAQPHKITIGDHDRFTVPFYLEPGHYSVKINVNGDAIFHTEAELTKEQRGLRLDLRKLVPPPPSSPATLPATTPSSPPF